jgi:hypothetical protein
MAIFLLVGKQKGSPEGTAPNERRTDRRNVAFPFGCYGGRVVRKLEPPILKEEKQIIWK